ncbi:MAG: hypothetical protein ACE5FA_02465 [Dehalococcoidia bacterium]
MASDPLNDYGECALIAESVRLTYNMQGAAGVAGTYTASIKVPAYAVIVDVIVSQLALWNAGTSAALNVGDDDDADGFYTAIDMKATDLLADESLSFSHPGAAADAGAYVDGTATHITNRVSSSDRTVTATIVTAGSAATTGDTIVTVVMARNVGSAAGRLTGSYVAT